MNEKEDGRFLLTDLAYKMVEGNQLPEITLYGKTRNSIISATIRDFPPYFYVKKTPDIQFIIENDPLISRWKLKTEEVTLRRYFWAGEKVKLLKVYGRNPRQIKDIKKEIEKLGVETFETDIPYLKRFLIDNNIKCLNVVKIKAKKTTKKGREIHFNASYRDIYPISDSEIASTNQFYPLKVMSIHIKVAREDEALTDLWQKKNRPIIAISIICGTDPKAGDGKFILLDDNSADGEKRMIFEFIRVLQEIQPDIICTFQGDIFDLPYLFHRMRVLNIPTYFLSLFKKNNCYYSRNLLSYRITGRMCFDLALRTWGIHPKSGRKGLFDIAEEVLGRGKYDEIKTTNYDFNSKPLEHGEINADKKFFQLWKEWIVERNTESLSLLAKISFYDCKLIYDLFWHLGMTGWVETLRVTGFPPAEGNSCTERLNGEFELMRYMRRKGIIIPERPNPEQVEINRLIRQTYPHEGGTVLYPKGSLHTGVLIADFQSMYPSVMIAQNIGGETLKQWIEASDYGDPKKLFDKQAKSCLSIMEETLINKRIAKKNEIKRLNGQLETETDVRIQQEIKNEIIVLEREQNSMKIVANSMYGAHFYIRSRFYAQTLASAIADSARSYLLGIEERLEKISKTIIPCELIYGDTDSTFIKILDKSLFTEIYEERDPKNREFLIAKLMRIVNSILVELNKGLPTPVELKFEDIAYRVVFKPDRKKAYSFVSLLTDEFKVKGFEAVRSDWSPISRRAQRKVLDILLTHSEFNLGEGTEYKIARRFLITLGVKILQMDVEELLPKVVIYTPIKRAPETYKAKAPAVQAFRHYAKEEQIDGSKEWMNYDKFPWVIIAGKGNVYDRARHPKFVDDIDREHYVTEMLRCCEDLGVKVSLKEVKGALPSGRLHHLFEKAEREGLVIEQNEDDKIIAEPSKSGEFEVTAIMKPVKEGELIWRSKVKGIRRNVQRRRPSGQSALTMFTEVSEEDSE